MNHHSVANNIATDNTAMDYSKETLLAINSNLAKSMLFLMVFFMALVFPNAFIHTAHANTSNIDIAKKYQASCATCHASGNIGAQKTGDKAQWSVALKKGMPTLVANVKNGYKNMPARGLCNDCTDADYSALIEFMSK